MQSSTFFVVSVAATAGALSTASAQPSNTPPSAPAGYYGAPQAAPPLRGGFYAGVGLGVGGLEFTEDDGGSISEDRETSGTLSIRLGGAISPRLLIGANLGGWGKSFENSWGGEDVTLTLVNVSAELTYYPLLNPQGVDLYVRGGLGTARVAVSDSDGDEIVGESGVAGHLGVGIEKRVGRRMALGFGFNLHGGSFDEGGANYVDGALSLTWY